MPSQGDKLLRDKELNVLQQTQTAPPAKFVFHISAFAFKHCSASEDRYWRDEHHPKRKVVHQALAALAPTSSIVVFTEIDGGPLCDMQETLKRQYGFDNHAVEMRLTETSVAPKRAEALTHSSRGNNLVAWDTAVFRRICVNDMTLKRWTFPGVVLHHRETGKIIWMVGLHLTPRREHRALLNELDKVRRHCLRNNVGECVAGTIAVGDLNVQYIRSFGKSRLEDKRYIWSLEDRRTEPNRRTNVDNPMRRRLNQKRQPQCRTKENSRTEQKHRTRSFGIRIMEHKRRVRSLKNRRTELECHIKVKHRVEVKRRTKSNNGTRSQNALGAFVATSDGTAQSDSDMVHVSSCNSVKLPKEYRVLMRSTDHPTPLRVSITF